MGLNFILLKKICLLFLLIVISAAFISTSFAGRVHKSEAWIEVSTTHEEIGSSEAMRHDDVSEIHERLLKVKTNDYGKYDSAPTMAKPHFKLIPN
ncbi:hypothetical protein CASFOL_042118 [Castilleja foliolosa]|uniref:Uncharacterized protein n=1 Tax=Castilleja foliolosa TaxID=1961234 RepID=A0ABD3BA85_9LAMI